MSKKLYNTLPLASLVASIAVAFIADIAFPVANIVPAPFDLFGVLVVLGAIAFMTYAGSEFATHATTPAPGGEPTSLITTGAFRFTRNPLYLGDLLIAIGIAIFMGSLTAFLAPILFFAFINTVIIPREEQKLRDIFGDEYGAYASTVRRWL